MLHIQFPFIIFQQMEYSPNLEDPNFTLSHLLSFSPRLIAQLNKPPKEITNTAAATKNVLSKVQAFRLSGLSQTRQLSSLHRHLPQSSLSLNFLDTNLQQELGRNLVEL
ncbi:hypothetical protein Droror1_Dr00007927 [Drosera rotundifolia]